MARVDLSRICAELAELPPESRVAACLGLAAAAQQAVRSGPDARSLRVFDPLECHPDDAERCAFYGRPVEHDQRICLVAIDGEVSCGQS
ncbi:MAG: hypothetical protein HZB56_08550 [Deltaproteobacteria bacterium]|nr:hypothetical protein [Deltaproteobacteria bacterium]